MTPYQNHYKYWLSVCTRRKKSKIIGYISSYNYIRLDPKDPTKLQVYYKRHIQHPVLKTYTHFPHVYMELAPTQLLIKIDSDGTRPLPEECGAEYGTTYRTWNPDRVDIGLNNRLDGFGIRHEGNGVTGKPGFKWYSRGTNGLNCVGDVLYDDLTGKISPTRPETMRTVNEELRERINKLTRKTYKRMRALDRMGAKIDFNLFRPYDAKADILAAMETFDARSQEETARLCWTIAVHTRYGAKLLAHPNELTVLRRSLFKHYRVIKWG